MIVSILSDLPKSIVSDDYAALMRKYAQRIPVPRKFDSVCLAILSTVNNVKTIFFIHRSPNVPTHKNQMAFIGGHHEDCESEFETGKREFEEELGLSSDLINFYGLGPAVYTRNQKIMLPIFCEVPFGDLSRATSNGEWDFACFYPLDKLLIESSWSHFNFHHEKHRIPVFLHHMNFNGSEVLIPANGQRLESFILWGATARVAWNLVKYLKERGIDGKL